MPGVPQNCCFCLSLSGSLSNVLGGAYVRACCVRLQIKQVNFVVQLLGYLIVSNK